MSSVCSCRATAYHHASDLPAEFWAVLRQNEPAANTILPFAKKALDFPRGDDKDQLWVILHDGEGKDVEFVLSCTTGVLGNYPIFVYTPKSSAQLVQAESHLADSLLQLVLCLLREVPPQRVFSVFSLAIVAETFVEIFEDHAHLGHGIRALKDAPYYDGTFMFCTRETLNPSLASFTPFPESRDFLTALRRADISNLEGLKVLCKGFSYTVPPYMIDEEHAELEARTLIANRQVWVYMVKRGNEDWETACFVAATAESDNVTTVTKIFTAEKWRGHGCATRLLHCVCRDIEKNKIVAFYVENSVDSRSARKMYQKIGFQAFNAQEQDMVNAERWVEIGFQGTTLGYW